MMKQIRFGRPPQVEKTDTEDEDKDKDGETNRPKKVGGEGNAADECK